MEPTDPPRKNYGLKSREFDRVNAAGTTPEKSIAHDVHSMLRQNRAAEKKAGVNAIEIKEVKSRRKRDYWLVLIPSTGLLALIAWLGRGSPYVLVYACSGIVILGVGLTWVMWFVMDDY